METLVLSNKKGEILRSFDLKSNDAEVIYRKDLKRIELCLSDFAKDGVDFEFERLGSVVRAELVKKPFLIEGLGEIRFIDKADATPVDQLRRENSKTWLTVGIFFLLFSLLIVRLIFSVPPLTKEQQQEKLKQQVVQLLHRAKIEQPKVAEKIEVQKTEQAQAKQSKKVNLQNIGALKVLGRLSQGSKGGLNLGAVQTSAGPGLGGTAGSGGVQSHLYAKGMVGAALGPGSNVSGQGGYGTKGKGGGQDGYGSMSLVGSAKAMPVPMTGEAEVDEGLDRDAIAEVIQRNLGQIRFCYEQGLQVDPKIAGRVAVSFVIDGNGAVKTASVSHTSLNSKTAEDCILLRLRSWRFPLPKGGVDVKVVYPFVLQRTSS